MLSLPIHSAIRVKWSKFHEMERVVELADQMEQGMEIEKMEKKSASVAAAAAASVASTSSQAPKKQQQQQQQPLQQSPQQLPRQKSSSWKQRKKSRGKKSVKVEISDSDDRGVEGTLDASSIGDDDFSFESFPQCPVDFDFCCSRIVFGIPQCSIDEESKMEEVLTRLASQ